MDQDQLVDEDKNPSSADELSPRPAPEQCAEMIACGVDDDDPTQAERHDKACPAYEPPQPAWERSVLMVQYPLHGIKAEYFTGPTSDSEFNWRTMPMLLRRVADWMDAVDLQDPEFESIETRTTFIEETPDSFYQTITIYYRENVDTKPVTSALSGDNNCTEEKSGV